MEQAGPKEERRQGEEPVSPFSGLSHTDGGNDDGGNDDVGMAAAAVLADNGDTGTELITDQDEFLRRIHQNFLNLVTPPHFIDELREAKALSSEEEESIRSEKTRRNGARKLWDMLHRIPPEDFAKRFVPQLRTKYPHMMQGVDFRLSDGPSQTRCLRHFMRRHLNPHRVVDLLPSHQCCTRDQYRCLTASQFCGDREWQEVFHLLHKHSANPDLCAAMESMLSKKKIGGAVAQYREAAAGGFVCTCHEAPSFGQPPVPPEPSNADDKAVVKSMQDLTMEVLLEEESSATYPSSPLSSKSQALDGMSDMSERVDSGVGYSLWNQQFLPLDLPPFQTLTQKNHHRRVEEEINHALTRTSNLRTDFRFLEKLRDDARSRARQAQDEALTPATSQELSALLERARWHLGLIHDAFQEVQGTWENVADLDHCLGPGQPESWTSYIRIRHHLLRNEVQECRHFAHKADSVFKEVTAICRPFPPAQEREPGAPRGEERRREDPRDGGDGDPGDGDPGDGVDGDSGDGVDGDSGDGGMETQEMG